MKKFVSISAVMLSMLFGAAVLFSQPGTDEDGNKAKSARAICIRKCGESRDKCYEKPGMNRVSCAKAYTDCVSSCQEMLND